MSNDHSDPDECDFCDAYWKFLRSEVALEPTAQQFNLSDRQAAVLREQCEIMFNGLPRKK